MLEGITYTDRITQAIRDGETHISLEEYYHPPKTKNPLGFPYIMLGSALRGYVIRMIKAPLEKAIILAARRMPDPTRENVGRHNALVLMDIRDEFFKHYINPSKMKLYQAAIKIGIGIVAHDAHHGWILSWWIDKLVEERMKGNWIPKAETFSRAGCWQDDEIPEKFPDEGCWKKEVL